MLYQRINPSQEGTETPVTVVFDQSSGQVTVTDTHGETLIKETFNGDVNGVLAFVDEMGITLEPSFKVLDKYAQPSQQNDQQVKWEALPLEYDENNPTAEHAK